MADFLGVCPLCGHPHCSQTHILCNCPGLATERAGLAQDLALLVNRLRPGPERSLGRAIHHQDIDHHGQLWTGLWTAEHRALLSPHLRLCTHKEGQRILLNISTWTTSGVTTLWTHFKEHVQDLEPLPTLPTTLPNAPNGRHGAPRPGHGPLRLSHAGPTSAGVTLPPNQATATQPPLSGTAPTDSAAASHRPCSQAPHGRHHGADSALQPSNPPLSMD